ncbi:MAG: hypothetical protein MUO87_03235, partial [Thermoplasmata archaeon]|nr:hypothetical protein [Thermoplasmata archaeon]
MKCPSCGKDNPDYSFYCGCCAMELPKPTAKPRAVPAKNDERAAEKQTSIDELVLRIESDPQVAIAINTRRIFLIMLLGMFLVAG